MLEIFTVARIEIKKLEKFIKNKVFAAYIYFPTAEKIFKILKNLQFNISKIKIQKISNCFANRSTTFF